MATADQEIIKEPMEKMGPADYIIREWLISMIRNAIIGLAIIVTIWSILSFSLPNGWWHLVINISGFLLTSFWAWSMKKTLTLLINGPVAWVIAMSVWLVSFFGLRTIEVAILAAIF